MRRTLILFFVTILPLRATGATLSGFIQDNSNGEALAYANVVLKWEGPTLGALANQDGYYAIKNIPRGTYFLEISFIGYATFRDSLAFEGEERIRLTIALEPAPIRTEEVVVEAERYKLEREAQTGFLSLEASRLKDLPAVGESDILRSLQLLPGIQAASDISSGLYIRGGGPDQTLILLDQIPLYNPSHAFGFFSTFNPDAIRDMSLYKGAFPAQYGGRLGAVLDVHNRDGNRKDFEATGGISLISARMTVEGPMTQGSWMVSGRRTYLDPILAALRTNSREVPAYFFYDLNAKLNRDFGDQDNVAISGYFGRDDLHLDLDEGSFVNIRWGNTAFTGKWTHVFSPALFGNFMVAGSQYASKTSLSFFETPIQFSNAIQDLTFKADLDYFASSRHTMTAGFLGTLYDFSFEEAFNQQDQISLEERPKLLSVYVQDLWQPGAATSIRLGLRTNYFSEGRRCQIEPRFSFSRRLSQDLKLKLGGGIYHQYLQLVTTEAFSGGDFWVPLDRTVEPGRSLQGVAGIEWEPSRRYQTTTEFYYTGLKNLVVLDNNVAVDSEESTSEDVFVSGGTGFATGVEIFLHRRAGALTGWVGYTLGWTRRRFGELNRGRRFPPKYDRRNDLRVVGNYRLDRWSFGANLIYGTGQAFTPASARYTLRSPATAAFLDDDFVLPAARNSGRLLPYHRIDLNVARRFELFGSDTEVCLQIFNVYNRRNEWFVQYYADSPETDPEVVKMLPIVPTLGINFKL